MSGFIGEQNVMLNQDAKSREEALRIVSKRAVELGVADDEDEVFTGFLAREQIDQTGMVDGFAIPHCKTGAIKQASIVIFKNSAKLEWPSLDGKPIDVAVALFVPEEEAGTTHIRLLAKVAQLLMDDDFKGLLRGAGDAASIAAAVNAALEE